MVSYNELSVKLNLCEEYTIYRSLSNRLAGQCIDKKEIDSVSFKGVIIEPIKNFKVWERYSENSIWTFGTVIEFPRLEINGFFKRTSILKYENYDNTILSEHIAKKTFQIFS